LVNVYLELNYFCAPICVTSRVTTSCDNYVRSSSRWRWQSLKRLSRPLLAVG